MTTDPKALRTEVYRKIIDHPSAWTTTSLGGKAGLIYRLTERQLDAFDELLAKLRHLKPQQVTRKDFDHSIVNTLLDDLRELIMNGRGAVVINGITRDRYDEDAFERLYWGFGTHWGNAAVQSSKGDRLGHVRDVKDNPHRRGYQTSAELLYHTDAYEVVGLMCVQKAFAGGESHLVSVLAMHNEILRNRPELLEPLYRGFPTSVIEARGTQYAVTDYNVPMFSCIDGKVSCLYSRTFMRAAAGELGVAIPSDLEAACDYFDELSNRPDLRLEFMLEPGEIMVWNNFTTLHARKAFEDKAELTRHLLRLWLNVPQGRSVISEILTWGRIYDTLMKERQAQAAVN
jgi:hypothetical protein